MRQGCEGGSNVTRKVLWAVDMPNCSELLAHAKEAGVAAVCVRSSNKALADAIDVFHRSGIEVHAWRWPAVKEQPHSSTHYYAIDEANYVVEKLMPLRLDGYIVDPESDCDGGVNDWNHVTLAPLARQFCEIIKNGAQNAGLGNFQFGVTSGCAYPPHSGKPNIPWQEFVAASNALYPQCYWRWTNPQTGKPQDINGGTPAAAIRSGLAAWRPIAGGKKIVPMAGELAVITPGEITSYATDALDATNELHFYADAASLPAGNLDAIKAL